MTRRVARESTARRSRGLGAREVRMGSLSDDGRFNLTTVELWNCRNAFEFVCPRFFRELEPTDEPGVRFCGVCSERVYLARTPGEFVAHGNRGHCVATPA